MSKSILNEESLFGDNELTHKFGDNFKIEDDTTSLMASVGNNAFPPFFITEADEILGKEWRASRNLRAGSILLDEIPAFYSPRWTQHDLNNDSVPNCLTCGLYMDTMVDKRCDSCHWPICSTKCAKMDIHAKNECQIFGQRKIPFPPHHCSPFSPADLCDSLTLLRGVGLKKQNIEVYKEVMSLQDFYVEPQFNDSLNRIVDEVVEKLQMFIGPLDHPVEDYKKIARLKKVNAFGGPGGDNEGFDTESSTLIYLKVSRLNHSCHPNCTWSLGPWPDQKIRIRTAIPVQKGDHLTIQYCLSDGQLATFGRQLAIRNGFGFICRCVRCLDPTELGTFVSAVTCQMCLQEEEEEEAGDQIMANFDEDEAKFGYLLHKDPLNLTPNSVMRCHRCQATKRSIDLMPLVLIGQQLQDRKNKKILTDPLALESGAKEDVEFYQKFIQKYKGRVVHKNHWVIQRATEAILNCQTSLKNFMTKKELQHSVQLYRYILDIQDKTCPGISAQRGLTLRNLSAILLTLLAHFSASMTPTELQEWTQFCKKTQVEALSFYKNDITHNQPKGHANNNNKSVAEKLMEEIKILEENMCLNFCHNDPSSLA